MSSESSTVSASADVNIGIGIECSSATETKKSEPQGTGKDKTQKPMRMMSSSQLSDLFRRLDRDGSGTLDLVEFKKIVEKLGLEVEAGELNRIFKSSDVQESSSLSLREFQSAYSKLYLSVTKKGKIIRGEIERGEFVRVLRYGNGADKKYFVEEYVGTTVVGSSWKKTTSDGTSVITETLEKMTLEDLKTKAFAEKGGCYWWFDIAMHDVSDDISLKEITRAFDVPESEMIAHNYNNFGNMLNTDPRYRMSLGKGNTSSGLSLFTQALWIKGRPLRYLLPLYLDFSTKGEDWFTQNISAPLKDYYSTRFAWLFHSSGGHAANAKLELKSALEAADALAKEICGDESEFEKRHAVPVSAPFVHQRSSDPTWLMPSSELKKHQPKVQYSTLGLHLLMQDNASEPGVLLTIRKLESDDFKSDVSKLKSVSEMDVASRSGIIGRILAGVRSHLYKVIVQQQGIHEWGGGIADRLVDLAVLITGMVHNFSMNTSGALEEWIAVLEEDSIDLPVSKHTEHCRSLKSIIASIDDYVMPLRNLLVEMKEVEEQRAAVEASSDKSKSGPNPTLVTRRKSILPVKDLQQELRPFWGEVSLLID